MNIHSQDQDLLLLAHNDLPLGRRLCTQIHVVLCYQCRTRLAKMEGASRLLADTIRGRDLSPWRFPTPNGAVAAARTATAWLAVFSVLFILTLAAVTQIVTRVGSPAAQNGGSAGSPSGGCRPDLPSDRCR